MSVILPLQSHSRLSRTYSRVSSIAGWCSWRCPLAAFVLVLVAQLGSTLWLKTACYGLSALLIAALFCAAGAYIGLSSFLVRRSSAWLEQLGKWAGVLGGAALMVLGLVGGWLLFRSSIL